MFSDTERDSQKTAENNIHHHSKIVAWANIFIPFFINHIGHISGKHSIKRCCCQKGKDKNIQNRTGEKFSLCIADLVKSKHHFHAHQTDDDHHHRGDGRHCTVCKSQKICRQRILFKYPVQSYTDSSHFICPFLPVTVLRPELLPSLPSIPVSYFQQNPGRSSNKSPAYIQSGILPLPAYIHFRPS